MSHEYVIYQGDQSRAEYAAKLRVRLHGWSERRVPSFNPDNLEEGAKRFPYRVIPNNGFPPLPGHLGIWYSVLSALENLERPFVAFDDDVRLSPKFMASFQMFLDDLPEDADFLSLYKAPIWIESMAHPVGRYLSTVYTPYGGPAIYWTPKGARQFIDLASHFGINAQYDNQLYGYAWAGEMKGYMLAPKTIPVVYTRDVPSTIQNKG